MSAAIEITVSSQLNSANASSAIAHHSGKENRMRFEHANQEIDKSKTHLNVELDLHDRDELLMRHYGEMIEKHNKQNNSAARRWDLKTYLETFEGKTVKIGGKETKNQRWATATQVSYFGGKDSLGPILEEIEEAGATPEEICAAYAEGYADYVQQHNEKFPTLPIYHSDIHFDETTPHGHDAIVVMGHTQKGKPSDSINNALGEMYGYPKDFAAKKANMARYRDENDEILFISIAPKLEALGAVYGVDVEFEPIRTGEAESLDYRSYKQQRKLDEQADELAEKEDRLDVRVKGAAATAKRQRERDVKQDARENTLNARENDLAAREGAVIARERALREERERMSEAYEQMDEKLKRLAEHDRKLTDRYNALAEYDKEMNKFFTGVTLAVIEGDPKLQNSAASIRKHGVRGYPIEKVQGALQRSIERMSRGERSGKTVDPSIVQREVDRQDDRGGPEL